MNFILHSLVLLTGLCYLEGSAGEKCALEPVPIDNIRYAVTEPHIECEWNYDYEGYLSYDWGKIKPGDDPEDYIFPENWQDEELDKDLDEEEED